MKIGDSFEYKDIMLRIERQRSEYSCDGCAFYMENKKREHGCLATKEEYFAGYCMQCRIVFASVSGSIRGTFLERRLNLILNR